MKKAENIQTSWLARAGIIVFLAVSAACGGGGGGGDSSPIVGSPPPPPTPNPPPPQPDPGEEIIDNQVSGSVGDGPITGAAISVYNKQGTLINTISSDQEASFEVLVREKGKYYPLTLTATSGLDVVTGAAPDFDLRSVVAKPSSKTQGNINPHSTLIVKAAEQMTGGLTDNNLASARASVMGHMNFGMDSAIVADPVTAPVTDESAPVLVKSSETLGEMVRRTRDALISTGYRGGSGGAIDGNAVVEALAADIIDGVIDGRGGPAADARIAGVANVASAVVLVEALINELKVGGTDATARMDNAILLVRPNAPASATTANVTLPAAMLSQTALVVEAALAFTGDPLLQELLDAVRAIPADARAENTGSITESGQAALANALNDAAFASDAEIEIINAAVRNTSPAPPPPPPPPPAPDPDPDPAPGNGTATVSWTPPTEREDGSPLNNLAGFRIYYGQDPNQLNQSPIVLNNPGLTAYMVDSLQEQTTWYFAVSAFDADGRESALSNIASKSFP